MLNAALNKRNKFDVKTEITISDDETDASAVQVISSVSLYPRPKESPSNLNDRKQLIENIKKSLEVCEIRTVGTVSVRTGYCFNDFIQFFKKVLEQEQIEFS